MPIWYDPQTRRPFILEAGQGSFKRLVGSHDFTVSFKSKPPGGLKRTAIRDSKWWLPSQQTLLVLDTIGETHVVGTIHREGFTLKMPVSKRFFLQEYRYVPPLIGTYWSVTWRERADGQAPDETICITMVRGLKVYYAITPSRELYPRFMVRRPRRPRHSLSLLELLRQGYQRTLPEAGDTWLDPHGELVEVVRRTKTRIVFRNLLGGQGACSILDFFYLFHQPRIDLEPVQEKPKPEPDPEPPTAWDRIS